MDMDMMKQSSSSSVASASAEEHMDMMTMMMQMEKLPDFCTAPDPFQEIQFPSANPSPTPTRILTPPPPVFQNPPPNFLPFIQEPLTPPPPPPPTLHPNLLLSTKFKYTSPPQFSNTNTNTFLSSIEKKNSMAAMREMIFRIAVMQPIHIDPESIKPPKRRNVKISKDPQSVAARHRRERISERIRILQRLVPGGTKMDTASMLDEAIHYVKFLKKQVQSLEQAGANRPIGAGGGFGFLGNGMLSTNLVYGSSLVKNCQPNSVAKSMLGSVHTLR